MLYGTVPYMLRIVMCAGSSDLSVVNKSLIVIKSSNRLWDDFCWSGMCVFEVLGVVNIYTATSRVCLCKQPTISPYGTYVR